MSDSVTVSSNESSSTVQSTESVSGGSIEVPENIDQAHWPTVIDHVERAETLVYWVSVDSDWNVTAASRSFQQDVLNVLPEPTTNFLESLGPGLPEHLTRRESDGDLDGQAVEVVHAVRGGARTVMYRFRSVSNGWMLFGRDRSDQLELVSQMAVLIEDLDVEMQRARALARRRRPLVAHAPHTGRAHPRHLAQVLEARWSSFESTGKNFSIIVIDVDKFKSFNDNYGHDVGDEVLRRVSEAISGSVRENDTASRLGGDEFVVVANTMTVDEAAKIGERIRTRVSVVPMPCGAGRISVSVGVACTAPTAPSNVEELFKWADNAVLRSKELGRNCVEKWEKSESGADCTTGESASDATSASDDTPVTED